MMAGRRVRAAAAACTSMLTLAVVAPAPAGAGPGLLMVENTSSIFIPDSGNATPYPSTIQVPGPSLPLTHVEVVINGLSIDKLSDVSIVVVGPTGAGVLLAHRPGGGNAPVTDVTWRFQDDAPPLAQTTGAYRPTARGGTVPAEVQPDAPRISTATELGALNGTNPAGTWSLFVADGEGNDVPPGTIAQGWSLFINVPSDLCVQVVDDGFEDVPDANVHEPAIDCIAAFGIANGKTPTTFDPTGTVSRGQMATFVANAMGAGGQPLPADPPDAFDDDDGSTHERSIDGLAAAGVIGGNGESGPSYSPAEDMRRDHMASYLFEAFATVTGTPLPAGADAFDDDAGNPHEAAINALAAKGVVSGTGGGAYDPAGTVSRAQMGSFLARFLMILDEAGAIA